MARRIFRGRKAPLAQHFRGEDRLRCRYAPSGPEVGWCVVRLGSVTPDMCGDPREEEGVAAGPISPKRRWSLSYI